MIFGSKPYLIRLFLSVRGIGTFVFPCDGKGAACQIYSIKRTGIYLSGVVMQDPPLSEILRSPARAAKPEEGICVVIPAYNDALSIGSLLISSAPLVSKVLVIDDCSDDSTADIARSAGVAVIRNPQKMGFEESVLTGIRSAYAEGFPAMVVITGDARFHPGDIPRLCEPVLQGHADLVIGSRYLLRTEDLPVHQKINQQLYRPEGAMVSDPVTDPCSGFFAMGRKAAGMIETLAQTGDLHRDLLYQISSQRLPICEIPVTDNPAIRPKWEWIRSVPVLVAIPAFNEERTIGRIVDAARDYCDAVLVLNDGSTDATATIARRMDAIVVSHPKNQGYGAALRSIFFIANAFHCHALVILDADGQHDPGDIEKILAPLLDGADIVIGSRTLENGNEIPLYRKTGMRVLDAATNYAGNLAVTDSQSGFRAYSQKAIRAIRITESDMGAGSEILVQAKDLGLSIVEVPVCVQYGQKVTSRNPLSHGIRVMESIIWHVTQQRPLLLISLPGLILCIIGIYFGTILLQLYKENGYFSLPLSVLVAIFLILGALGIFMGVTFHVIARILPKYEQLVTRIVHEENTYRK